MRIALLLLAVAACSEKSERRGDPPRVAAEDDEPCDPKEPRVCVGDRVYECNRGKLGRSLRTCREGCRKGKCNGACADGAELIYVVDSNDNLLSFDPRKLPRDPFAVIGRIDCSGSTPFSMGVDRSGTAWVVYQSGEIFEVSTIDASCKPSGYAPGSSGSSTFGMGFVTDEPGGKTEKLYIAANDGSQRLSYIDTTRDVPTAHRLGTIEAAVASHPELTGTSEAKLFGFFPVEGGTSFVQEIDRTTGAAVGQRWNLGDSLDFVTAYAFAQWGGVFYIFVSSGSRSTVRAIDRSSGEYRMVMDSIPYRIVGAGVSTCAPEKDGGGTRTN